MTKLPPGGRVTKTVQWKPGKRENPIDLVSSDEEEDGASPVQQSSRQRDAPPLVSATGRGRTFTSANLLLVSRPHITSARQLPRAEGESPGRKSHRQRQPRSQTGPRPARSNMNAESQVRLHEESPGIFVAHEKGAASNFPPCGRRTPASDSEHRRLHRARQQPGQCMRMRMRRQWNPALNEVETVQNDVSVPPARRRPSPGAQDGSAPTAARASASIIGRRSPVLNTPAALAPAPATHQPASSIMAAVPPATTFRPHPKTTARPAPDSATNPLSEVMARPASETTARPGPVTATGLHAMPLTSSNDAAEMLAPAFQAPPQSSRQGALLGLPLGHRGLPSPGRALRQQLQKLLQLQLQQRQRLLATAQQHAAGKKRRPGCTDGVNLSSNSDPNGARLDVTLRSTHPFAANFMATSTCNPATKSAPVRTHGSDSTTAIRPGHPDAVTSRSASQNEVPHRVSQLRNPGGPSSLRRPRNGPHLGSEALRVGSQRPSGYGVGHMRHTSSRPRTIQGTKRLTASCKDDVQMSINNTNTADAADTDLEEIESQASLRAGKKPKTTSFPPDNSVRPGTSQNGSRTNRGGEGNSNTEQTDALTPARLPRRPWDRGYAELKRRLKPPPPKQTKPSLEITLKMPAEALARGLLQSIKDPSSPRNGTDYLSTLPTEIRTNIYRRLVVVDNPIKVQTGWSQLCARQGLELCPAILGVNKMHNAAATPLLYGANEFLYVLRDPGLMVELATGHERTLPLRKHAGSLRYLILQVEPNRVNGDTFQGLCEAVTVLRRIKATKLQKLTIELSPRVQEPATTGGPELVSQCFWLRADALVMQTLKELSPKFLYFDVHLEQTSTSLKKSLRAIVDLRAETGKPELHAVRQKCQEKKTVQQLMILAREAKEERCAEALNNMDTRIQNAVTKGAVWVQDPKRAWFREFEPLREQRKSLHVGYAQEDV